MNIIAIIPARGGSKTIKNKNIIPFFGKPLIAWTIEQAKASKHINKIYVSSDSKEILLLASHYGATRAIRPEKLATDTSPSEDAIKHLLCCLSIDKQPDIIVFLQATSPIREKNDIDNAIDLFIKEKADSLFSAGILDEWCVWTKEKGQLKSFSFDYKNRGMRQTRQKYYLDNGSIYIFKPKILWQNNNRLGGKIVMYEMPLWRSFEIDDKESLELCKMSMIRILHGGK